MKDQFKHKYNFCYDNSFTLLENKLVDYVVIGYMVSNKHKFATRHGWCIRDNKIVDSTLADDYKGSENYIEAFKVTLDDAIEMNYQEDIGLSRHNDIRELKLINKLKNDGYIPMPSFDSIQDLRIFRKLIRSKVKKLKSNLNT